MVERMRAQTGSYRRGRSPEATYRAAVARFWSQMGVGGGAPMVPPASAPPARAPSPARGPRPSASSPVAPPPAAAPAPAPAPAIPNLAEQLAGLARLHAEGILTAEELAAAKRRLLED